LIEKNSELTVMNFVFLPTYPNQSERTSTMEAIVSGRDEDRACSTILVALGRQLDCARQLNLQIAFEARQN
jgi:hypothetical protein